MRAADLARNDRDARIVLEPATDSDMQRWFDAAEAELDRVEGRDPQRTRFGWFPAYGISIALLVGGVLLLRACA